MLPLVFPLHAIGGAGVLRQRPVLAGALIGVVVRWLAEFRTGRRGGA